MSDTAKPRGQYRRRKARQSVGVSASSPKPARPRAKKSESPPTAPPEHRTTPPQTPDELARLLSQVLADVYDGMRSAAEGYTAMQVAKQIERLWSYRTARRQSEELESAPGMSDLSEEDLASMAEL